MSRVVRGFVLSCLGVFLCHAQAQALSEMDILLDKLVDKGVLSSVEAGLIRQEIKETKEERDQEIAQDIVPEWSRNWRLKGELRLRDEYRDRTANADFHRQRIRLRLGMEGRVTDELKVEARLATGSLTDPVSTNQTFDDTFSKKTFNLDLAYVEYAPSVAVVESLRLKGGIFENPFWTASPLVWDEELGFAGASGQLEKDLGPVRAFLNAGAFPIDSDGFGTDNPSLWGGQAGLALKPFESSDTPFLNQLKVKGAFAYYDYKNSAKNALVNTPSGNSAAVDDFNELNPSVEISSKVGALPVSAFGDWVHNASVESDENGYHVGLKLGKAKRPWDLVEGWEAGYFIQRLEPDAAFDGFVDSDFGGGGTNHKGNVFWVKLAVLENSTFGVKYFDTKEVTGSKNHFDTVQMDWVTKF
ncbi:MAG: putative porin [Candidatus Omnitrophica bacterium]|nr:putative porin [Candidatus Omnitrophota bacterium]